MLRRIGAWVLIAGFVLLILNIAVFRVEAGITGIAYSIIVVIFLITGGFKNTGAAGYGTDIVKFRLGFGRGYKEFALKRENLLAEVRQNAVEAPLTGEEEVRRAIDNPIGTARLRDIIKPGERTVIVTSDITRPMPSKTVLPAVLEELGKAGVKDEDITIVFALGNHRRQTEEERKRLAGEEVFRRIRCIDSDPTACTRMGYTKNGTPVDIFREVAEADRRICLGNIEYHYFAGYSGGAKAIMPGVSSRDAIQANHSGMVRDGARAGAMEDNPVRIDMEEVVAFAPIDFIVNVVLDESKTIIKAVAGHHVKAHRAGCAFLDELYKVELPQKADIVVATPGGFPKDINLYQAQKALDNSKHAVRDGGIIILAASCAEGLGEEVFESWMKAAKSPEELIENIEKKFELGGHKAAAIALVLKKARIYLVSDMEPGFVKGLFMEPFTDIGEALGKAFMELGRDAKVLVMPFGGSTLPVTRRQA